jgi:hypothetical protein
MKVLILATAGILFLLISGFYGFASSPDYRKVLHSCLIFDFAALTLLGPLFSILKGPVRIVVVLLFAIGLAIGLQATYRLFLN